MKAVKLVLIMVAAVLLSAVSAAFAGYNLAPGPNHVRARTLAIASQIDQAADIQVLILGDSIVERADLSQACKARTINAGVSGATVADVEALSRQIDLRRAPRVVIAVGVNDAKAGARAPIDRVMKRYAALADYAASQGAKVTVATVVTPAASVGAEYDRGYISEFNGALWRLAKERGLDIIDLSAVAKDNGHLPAHLALDGVHLNAAGYREWSQRLAPGCA